MKQENIRRITAAIQEAARIPVPLAYTGSLQVVINNLQMVLQTEAEPPEKEEVG